VASPTDGRAKGDGHGRLATVLVCGISTRDVRACSLIVPGNYALDPTEQQLDHQPPATPVLSDIVVERGAVPNGCEG
jgi:hypothetical protein